MAGGKVIGPDGRAKPAGTGCGKSMGPQGAAGSNASYTTARGYDNSKTMRLQTNYRVEGTANNSKAGK